MPRIRSIHPDLHRDKTLAALDASAERTFVRLWCHLDDEGRGEDDPLLLKSDLYPRHANVTVEDVQHDLDQLEMVGLIIRYEVDGERYLCCKPDTWSNYQRPQKKQESKLPAPDQATTRPLRDRSDTATRPLPPVVEGRGVVEVEERESSTSDLRPDGDDEPDVSEDARRLTRQFAIATRENEHPIPKAGSKAASTWLIEMDRLLRIGPKGWDGDPPTPDEVSRVIGWVTQDSFEKANVLSVPKLRDRYSQLRLKALNTGPSRASPTSKGVQYAARYREAAAELERQGR